MCERTTKCGMILILYLSLQSLALSVEFAGGTGEPNDPYQIATVDQLIFIGTDSNLMSKHFILVNNIDMDPNLPNGQGFDGHIIGQSFGIQFEGLFNGNGYKILNLDIRSSSSSGLFGEIGSQGQVCNLGLVDIHVSGDIAGSLAVKNHGIVHNCYTTGTISGRNNVGGLVGENRGIITNCHSSCNVSGVDSVGGLVGRSYEGKVSSSYAIGSVTGDHGIGGLLGEERDTDVTQCYAACSTTGNSNVGGLIGRASHGTVTYCYATGSVVGDRNVGGLVGSPFITPIGWCYSIGSVSGTDRVGGLIGETHDTVRSCYFLRAADGGGPDNGYGSAMTLSQINQPASFIGWDFYESGGEGLAYYWFMPLDDPPVLIWQTEVTGLVAVPTVVGLSQFAAEAVLKDAGFVIGSVEYEYDKTIPAEHIARVWPADYAPVGTIIDIILSKGAYDWTYNPGEGNRENPYAIDGVDQLESLADHPDLWDKHFVLLNDINLAGYTYQISLIAADANDDKGDFQGTPFTGDFDGNGFAIRNLNIEPNVPSDFGFFRVDLGLFGKIGSDGRVHRIRLENVNVTAGIAGARWHSGTIGALAVENEGTILDCSVTGNVSGGEHSQVGALVGTNRGEIHSSYSSNGMVIGGDKVGGLVGWNEKGTLANCYATINVEGQRNVGGLVGEDREGILSFCYAAGPVSSERNSNAGGLIGVVWSREGTISNCFWDINMTGMLRSSGGMGLSTSEMTDADIYALNGWAGNSNWIIDDEKDYPKLVWEGTAGESIAELLIDWFEGAGTADDPYRIATVDQLCQIATASVIFNKYFLLTNDIDLAGIEWLPIGISTGTRFNGVFDGNNHIISNLSMADPNGIRHSGMALFGYTGDKAILKNLILTNAVVITGESGMYSSGNSYVSALAANNQGMVKNCHVQATLEGSNCGALAGANAGLILNCDVTCSISSDQNLKRVGCLVGDNTGGSIFGCRVSGSITSGDGSVYIGGAVGDNSMGATVIACSADVAITCGNMSGRVGGLVGFNWGTILSECYSSGKLSVGEQSGHIGGLVGENWSNVINCYASGTVTAGDGAVDSGGLVGGLGSTGKINGSYFLIPADAIDADNGIGMGLTDVQMRQQDSFIGWDFAGKFEDGMTDFWQMPGDGGYPVLNLFEGYEPPVLAGAGTVDDPYLIEAAEQLGFVARNPDDAYRLVADLDLTGIVSTTTAIPLLNGRFDGNGHTIQNLTMTGNSFMGLFGMILPQAAITDLGVLDANISGPDISQYVGIMAAFNKGTITACTVTGSITGGEDIGGLVGENEGEITDCYATCSVTGARHTGGLVGENNGIITTSYVNGQVLNLGDEWGIGALVGNNYRGSLVNCFWEKRTGLVISSDICQGLTTSQMMDKEIYSLKGWAENPNWVIDSGNDYPRLVWEGMPGEPIPAPTIDWLVGAGTPEDPYKIETVDQLQLIGIANVLWDKHFVLMADLDCSLNEFDRIGICPGTVFSGNFDGAYHRLKNLTLGSVVPRQRYLGFFGYIESEGRVSRLILENVSVSCGDLCDSVATLAAENYGMIVNCGAVGSLDCGDKCWGIGGLVGNNNGMLELCYSNVAIHTGEESGLIGGLVGDNNDRISNSYAIGSIHSGSNPGWIGGLTGTTSGPLIHCYSAGEIIREWPVGSPAGGLVADDFSGSSIVSCYFLGSDNGLGTQLSDEQLKKQESFVDWDFSHTWMIFEGEYPKLQWESLDDN